MKKTCVILALALCYLFVLSAAGCGEEATPGTAAPTVTAGAPTVTAGVEVTNESGTSACFIEDILSEGGRNYVVVDYINTDTYLPDSDGPPLLVNDDTELRTFLVPDDATIVANNLFVDLGQKTLDEVMADTTGNETDGLAMPLDALKQALAGGKVNTLPAEPGGYFRYWTIEVKDGEVVSLVEAFQP